MDYSGGEIESDFGPVGRGKSVGRGRGFRTIPSSSSSPSVPTQAKKQIGIASKIPAIRQDQVTTTAPVVPGSGLETSTSAAEGAAAGKQSSEPEQPVSKGGDDLEPPAGVSITVGSVGQRCQCVTNYIELKQTSRVPVFEYLVTFKPPLESLGIKNKLLRQLIKAIGPVSNWDGQTLFLPRKLAEAVTVVPCKNVFTGSNVEASIKFIKEREFKELCLFYNILFQRILTTLGFIEIRRGYYEPCDLKELPEYKLQVWPGISMNVEIKDGGVMVMIDTPKRTLHMDTAYDHYKAMKNAELPDFKARFENFIIGKIVRCDYSQKCYKIDDVAWDRNPTTEFPYKNGLITFKDYFKKQYKISIEDLQQPMLISRIIPKDLGTSGDHSDSGMMRAVALVPETCHLTRLTADQRSNFKILAAVKSIVRQNPTTRVNSMRALTERILGSKEAQTILEEWGITLHNDVMHVIGRTIQPPTLLFHKNEERQGQPIFRNECVTCYDPVEIKSFLVFCTKGDHQSAQTFVTQYATACTTIGIRLRTRGDIIDVKGNTPTDYIRELKTRCTPNTTVQFVVIILPGMRDDIYQAVKKYCLTVVPIPSQVILSRTLNNRSKMQQTAINICMQINCKLGGSLWGLKTSMKRIMFIGMDAAHDVTRTNSSIIALVASLNDTCTSYFSRCAARPIHKEVNTCLRPMFLDALNCYRKNNGEFPDHIVFFRDGGSAHTFDILKSHEVYPCLEVIKEESSKSGKPMNFSYLCVAKRIPQRVFLCAEGNNIINPTSGTVVDTSITKPSLYDFYIVSQLVTQGAVTPTHYTVLSETSPTKPDTMQKLAYATTFMYCNWQGTIKVPSVIQFAHKLGQLVSRIKEIPNRRMEEKLYFI